MNSLVITDINLVARFARSGLLKYIENDEFKFFISDICYCHKAITVSNDKLFAKKMIENGMLEVCPLNEHQILNLSEFYKRYKPRFLAKTISAIILTQYLNAKLISEDELLRSVAYSDFGIIAHDKEWLLDEIVREIVVKGVNLDIEIVKMII